MIVMWMVVVVGSAFDAANQIPFDSKITEPYENEKISEEYFFPKELFPWQLFESGQIAVDEIGVAKETFSYRKKPIAISFELGIGNDEIDKTSLLKIREDLPRKLAIFVTDNQYSDYDEEAVIVFEFPGIEVDENTRMMVNINTINGDDYELEDEIDVTDFPRVNYAADEMLAEPSLTTDNTLKQRNAVFEVENEAGNIIVVTLVELEEDNRQFTLLDTWIDSLMDTDDEAVRLTSSFNFSHFDTNKVMGFFDFRNLLWNVNEIQFNHSSCFEAIACHQPDNTIVECDYYYYQKRPNCSEIYETEIRLGKEWHHTELPVNRFVPVVFDSSRGGEKFVHLSPCIGDVTVVVEDLDGRGAAVDVPTVYLVGTDSKLELTAPVKYRSAYEHGLILYKLVTNMTEIPNSFLTKEAYIEITDHPISAIDSKSSKTFVKWKRPSCVKNTRFTAGKSVFHKVIPYCEESLITDTIQASLRQLEHIIDIDVLEIELSKSKTEQKGLNVVVTSASKSITPQQKREIEEAVNIGRILAHAGCHDHEETVDSLVKSTSIYTKLKDRKIKDDKGPMTRSHVVEPAALTAEEKADVRGSHVSTTMAILLIPCVVTILTGFTYFWCWMKLEFDLNHLVTYRVVVHWIAICELVLASLVWTEYGTTKEIVDEATTVSVSLLILIVFGAVGAVLRLISFYQYLLDSKYNKLECVHYILDCICRIMPFAVVVGLMIVKYRPPSFGPSILHIMCFVFQLLLIVGNLMSLLPPNWGEATQKESKIKTKVQLASFLLFNGMLSIVEIILIANAANPSLDLEAQNRCIMIEQVDTDSLLSFAAPWKCFTFTDKLMISFASISAVIGIALVVWYLYSSYFNRGCRGRLRSLSESYGSIQRSVDTQRSVKTKNEHFGSVSDHNSRADNSIKSHDS